MPLRAIHHVQLAMPRGGEDKARAFYSGLLEIPEVPKPEDIAARGGCWFEQGSLRIHLGVEDDFRPARKAHPAILVDDLQGMLPRLILEMPPGLIEGVRKSTMAVRPNGDASFYLDDPFGNRIELIEPHAES
jgi:catechol 2,3-dioxygenase-like lactoylglutathione lyase family enzyme